MHACSGQPAECKRPVFEHCTTFRLEPTWTSHFLREQQDADPDFKVIIGRKPVKGSHCGRRCCLRARAVKSLWSQWDPLLFRNRVLCCKWENDIGDQTNNQIVLPVILRQTAFEAHHSHTTASHRGVRKTINALQSRYWGI